MCDHLESNILVHLLIFLSLMRNCSFSNYFVLHQGEMELLHKPNNTSNLPMVQWPLILLASKIFLARDVALESRDSQEELWDRISRDGYMKYAVEEGYHTIRLILTAILDNEGKMLIERINEDIHASIVKRSIQVDFDLNKLALVISGEHYDTWNMLSTARNKGTLFSKLKWPQEAELKAQVKSLYSLLTIKDSATSVLKNLKTRRRLSFFPNSPLMNMPLAKSVREILSFSVFTPYYSEVVLYSVNELQKKNEDGISIHFYGSTSVRYMQMSGEAFLPGLVAMKMQ